MPYGYGSANRGSTNQGPAGGASAGGNYGGNRNPQQRSTPAPTYQNVHQTGAVTQTPGRPPPTVTTGGPPSILNPPTPTVTTGGPPRVLNPPPVIPKGRTHSGGITSTKDRRILNWLKNNRWKAAFSGLGGLAAGAGYQTLSDINKINQWAKMGYGTGSPVTANLLSQLKGAWVPNKVFEKLGHGAGSTMGWLTGRVSPTHFGPVEAAMKAFKSPIGKLATRASLPAAVGLTSFDLAMKSPTVQKYGTMLGEKIYDWTHKKDGGLINLYKHGGFSG